MPSSIHHSRSVAADGFSRGAVAVGQQIVSRVWGYWAVLVGALALSLVAALVPSALSNAPIGVRLGNLLVGVLFVSAGLLGIKYRPDSPVGALLGLAGFLYLVGRLQGADPPALWLIAVLANVAWQGIVFYIVFSFPDRRLRFLSARVIVTVAVVYTLANNLFGLVTTRIRLTPTGDANPFYVNIDASILERLRVALLYGGGIFIVVATGWLVRRWFVASPPLRRALTPIYLATFAVSTVALVLRFAVGVVAPTTDPAQVISIGLLIAFGLVPVAFLIGLLRAHMARSAVADLVVHLAEVPSPDRLRQSLAKALGDPTVEVFRWSEDAGYIREDGSPASLTVLDPGRAVTSIEAPQAALLAILHDASLLDDPGLISSVVTAVRLTLDNERLEARVQEQLEEVRTSRARITAAADSARKKIERDIHDGSQQQLVAAVMALQAAADRLDAESDVAEELDAVMAQLTTAIDELRELARGIHPAVLTERGLKSALAALARRSAIPVQLDISLLTERLSESVEAAAYFIASEAIANAQTHSNSSEIELKVHQSSDLLTVSVIDNGIGGASVDSGTGMAGMRDRAETAGGTLEVRSPDGGPTDVTAKLPLG